MCVVDQPALDGQYSVFGRVVEGMKVVQKISESPVDEKGKAIERIEIKTVTIRDRPVEGPEPFSRESPAELATYRVTLETTARPHHARDAARQGAGARPQLPAPRGRRRVRRHRVPPRGARLRRAGRLDELPSRDARREAAAARADAAARVQRPAARQGHAVDGARRRPGQSASTSFFICTAPAPGLDRVYTAFGRVVDGMATLEAIEATPVDGEKPKATIEIVHARVTRADR